MAIQPTAIAPDFTAYMVDGTPVRLSDLRGKWVLVFFYPADFTGGCTTEACSLNDNLPDFEKSGATLIGVSSQDQQSHSKWQEHHGFAFALAPDTDRAIGDAYDVPIGNPEKNRSKRQSFLVDPEGKVAEVWESVVPADHAAQVLAAINAHKSSLTSV